ncbi:hemolysin family protein [Treponema ruminis]|uniref:CBS domain containing-hemolysin-like protein n=1 Tax=Treponema ruminis TaxID=744515 RepID=A0A7W8LL22_9SPIR|nr:hemolysin family protein [Treponema ruminis]MBB5225017.1 CBS domain containing-hemolysin-like protein [Treponema ruminis]
MIFRFILAAVCITLSSLFSASESAFLGLNKLRVHFLREKGDKRATRAGKLLERKEELLNMLLVGNEIVNVALSVTLTAIFLKLFGTAGLPIATFIATVLLLIFGEITPKSVTTTHPETCAFALSGFVKIFFYLLRPFVIFFTFISRIILRLFGISTKKKAVSFTEDEIKTLIDVGGEEGVLEAGEKKMMSRVFKFTDLNATDIMIPRLKVICIDSSMSYRDVVQLSEQTRISKFPVYENDDIDNIIGVLYVKDMLFFTEVRDEFSVRKVMRPPLFIPGTTKMSSIQELLHENHQSFAIVIDEYSGTDGILTIEDIEQEIFGAVADDIYHEEEIEEREPSEFEEFFSKSIEGSTRLIDLNEMLRIKLESKLNETIAGYICEKLERIPMVGESIEESNYVFTVEKLEGHRIAKVHVEQHIERDDELPLSENGEELGHKGGDE